MAFGNNPTTTTQGALATDQIFISSVAVPGHSGGNLTALRGANPATDANGNETADASMAIPDGANVAQGTTTDVVWSGSGAGTVIAILKKLVAELTATLAISGSVSVSNFPGTQPVSGTVTANQGGSWLVESNGFDHTQAGFIFKSVQNVAITSGTPVSIWTPASGKKFRLMGIYLNTSNGISGTAILFEDGSGNEFLRLSRPQTNNIGTSPISLWPNGYLSTAANNHLYLDVVGNSSSVVEGFVWGYEE